MNDIEVYRQMQHSPRFFIKLMWGIVPERDNTKYLKGKNLTWQQDDILQAVEDAVTGQGNKRISVSSGRGIGKTTTLAWLLLWYLFCYKDAQIPCTAPTADQMYDVLWKEVAKWLKLMPLEVQAKYEWSNSYVRITESPETWFARAKTAKKEAPEALSGVHGDYVMFLVDEASGIDEIIFTTAEGALTNKNILFIMISNPTRTSGYFYDSHKRKDTANSWRTMQFSVLDSPIVDQEFVARIIEKYGEDSDTYRVQVQGQFPAEDAMDDKGFVPLFSADEIKYAPEAEFVGTTMLGVDPSGEGQDVSAFVVRDAYRAQVAGKERVSNPKSVAEKILTLIDYFNVRPDEVTVDSFGVGSDVGKEVALSGYHYDVNTINVGDKSKDEMYLNKRAEAYFNIKKWLRQGGSLTNDGNGKSLGQELLSIKFKRNLAGKIQIMSKKEMRDNGIQSPNLADALMLTFVNNKPRLERAMTTYPKLRPRNPLPKLSQNAG